MTRLFLRLPHHHVDRIAQSHSSHATRVAQDKDCVPHVEQKLLRKRSVACTSSWSRPRNQKSFTLTILGNLVNLVDIYAGIIVRQHRTDRKLMGEPREQCAKSRKGHLQCCCNQGCLKNGGRIPWNVAAFKISRLMGRHPLKGGSEYHLTAHLYRLEQWLNITLIFC